MTDDAELQPAVEAAFVALADALEASAPQEWETPSLCEGWRVREVVAHMTMAARYSQEQFMAELRACGFDFTRLSNQVAARDGEFPPAELLTSLRSDVMCHWTPPQGGYHGALNHVVIHGLDITAPLGLPRQVPDDALRIVLDDLTVGDTSGFFGVSSDGRSLRATDLDWSYGAGSPLTGTGADLALALTGRAVPEDRLVGEPLSAAATQPIEAEQQA